MGIGQYEFPPAALISESLAMDFTVRPSEYDDWCRLLGEVDRSPCTIVHFGAATDASAASIDARLDNGFYSVLALAQSIERLLAAQGMSSSGQYLRTLSRPGDQRPCAQLRRLCSAQHA